LEDGVTSDRLRVHRGTDLLFVGEGLVGGVAGVAGEEDVGDESAWGFGSEK